MSTAHEASSHHNYVISINNIVVEKKIKKIKISNKILNKT